MARITKYSWSLLISVWLIRFVEQSEWKTVIPASHLASHSWHRLSEQVDHLIEPVSHCFHSCDAIYEFLIKVELDIFYICTHWLGQLSKNSWMDLYSPVTLLGSENRPQRANVWNSHSNVSTSVCSELLHNFPQMTHSGYFLSVMNFILFAFDNHQHHI